METTPVYVNNVGLCERASHVSFEVSDNSFSVASTEEPVYLRLDMDHGAQLCRDLAFQPDGLQWIALPMKVVGEGAQINAAPRAVEIVRWVKDEPSIWLRINQSSSEWVRRNETVGAPSLEHTVTFEFGLTEEQYRERYEEAFQQGRANLPFATRQVNLQNVATSVPQETLLEVNLSKGNLEAI